ncbi:MAG: 2-oxoacid:acceptor oxidoreductase family protein [Rhodobacteraceae bacterium]|nr:2-oxoacid:acceptor oxidoreductase family protein [Paracoccaceae bacterium]
MVEKRNGPTNVLIVGVGGQGVIMVSKVLAQLCQNHGYEVKQSEVHGMAKRGGGVFSHVRYGSAVWSPTIPEGEADVLLALEWAEALRWINFMNPDTGTFIADTQRIVPPFACRARGRGEEAGYAPQTPEEIMAQVRAGYAIDATSMAEDLGNLKAANTVLLGALSTTLEFPVEDWLEVIRGFVPPHSIDINMAAFAAGREWAQAGDKRVEESAKGLHKADVELQQQVITKLEITEEWCKGCDICVKMCPERCLRLNEQLVAELPDPSKCTGCRMCEWLCPDFAIKITNTPVLEAAE